LLAARLKFPAATTDSENKAFALCINIGQFWHGACFNHQVGSQLLFQEDFVMKGNFIRGSVLALTLGIASMGSLWAQSSQPAQDTPAQSQSQAASAQNQTAKEFMGTIVKDNGALMLKDSTGNVSYKVDDESKVKDYVGKQVKVMGTLDSETHVIHVDSIQVIS
jgi:uncharacterized protein DUF5818